MFECQKRFLFKIKNSVFLYDIPHQRHIYLILISNKILIEYGHRNLENSFIELYFAMLTIFGSRCN